MHFLCPEPRETDKSVLKLSWNFLKIWSPEISLLAAGSPAISLSTYFLSRLFWTCDTQVRDSEYTWLSRWGENLSYRWWQSTEAITDEHQTVNQSNSWFQMSHHFTEPKVLDTNSNNNNFISQRNIHVADNIKCIYDGRLPGKPEPIYAGRL